ncbi:hypothetical protein ACJMK2_019779 [Sinanodonta woodiana]|uniref:Uncharacterized protein n=1 Tax=Sinanodonta woodiana TaxID=1069815 RepID=A0ABD3TY16_SINWO
MTFLEISRLSKTLNTCKKRQPAEDVYNGNLADHILNVESKIYSQHHLNRVVRHVDSGPPIILYTDAQIQNIKRLCCTMDGTVLGVDKTFKLGGMYLTPTVLKTEHFYELIPKSLLLLFAPFSTS